MVKGEFKMKLENRKILKYNNHTYSIKKEGEKWLRKEK